MPKRELPFWEVSRQLQNLSLLLVACRWQTKYNRTHVVHQHPQRWVCFECLICAPSQLIPGNDFGHGQVEEKSLRHLCKPQRVTSPALRILPLTFFSDAFHQSHVYYRDRPWFYVSTLIFREGLFEKRDCGHIVLKMRKDDHPVCFLGDENSNIRRVIQLKLLSC